MAYNITLFNIKNENYWISVYQLDFSVNVSLSSIIKINFDCKLLIKNDSIILSDLLKFNLIKSNR